MLAMLAKINHTVIKHLDTLKHQSNIDEHTINQ